MLTVLRIATIFVCSIFADGYAAEKESLIPYSTVNELLKPYKNEQERELERIKTDKKNIRKIAFDGARADEKPVYLATCGGPGASKTTILETFLKKNPGFAYIDPDQRTLKFMCHTYLSSLSNYEMSQCKAYGELLKKAYEKWRNASNYIAYSLLNEAFDGNYSIAHGTTSTSDTIDSLFQKLNANGYHIKLLLCVSPLENRCKAVEHRVKEQAFVQSSEEDLLLNGTTFLANFSLYFKWADEIDIYYIEDFQKGWTHVSAYTKGKKLEILHGDDFEKVKFEYEANRQGKESEIPPFEDLLPK